MILRVDKVKKCGILCFSLTEMVKLCTEMDL